MINNNKCLYQIHLYFQALEGDIVKRSDIWKLVFTDFNYKNFKYIAGNDNLNVSLTVTTMDNDVCCRFIGQTPCVCPTDFQVRKNFLFFN